MEPTEKFSHDLIENISIIARSIEKSALDSELLLSIDDEIRLIADYLQVSATQSILFVAIFANQGRNWNLDIEDINSYLGIDYLHFLRIKPDLSVLIEKNIIKIEKNRGNDFLDYRTSISINKKLIEAIYNNSYFQNKDEDKMSDNYEFAKAISDLIEERESENINTKDLFKETEKIESKNSHLGLISKLKEFGLGVEDRLFFYEVCDDLVQGGWSALDKTLKDIYDSTRARFSRAKEFTTKNNELFKNDLIRLSDGNFFNDVRIGLTDSGIELFLEEDAALYLNKKIPKNILFPEKIQEKMLFYPEEFEDEIQFIKKSLQEDAYISLQKRLEEHALPVGVTALFYGFPGTGKTETAMQIAKLTNRPVMHVDISQSKSMWFGESEKKIKEIFTEYNLHCKKLKTTPILLFNEANVLFGKRKDVESSNVAQTENAIQNILLEEMETMSGILIATTNLTDNLDTAFDRRFLFKLKFEQPDSNVKKKIWMNKLHWLTEETADRLAGLYDFSGGEIDNIVRKIIMQEVLNGVRPDETKILSYCNTEKLSGKSRRSKVGF